MNKKNTKKIVLLTLILFIISLSPSFSKINIPQKPKKCLQKWAPLIGRYKNKRAKILIYEKKEKIYLNYKNKNIPLKEISPYRFKTQLPKVSKQKLIKFIFDKNKKAIFLLIDKKKYKRNFYGTEGGKTFKITPLKNISSLRQNASKAKPPQEKIFKKPNLVEIKILDPTIKLDIKYATKNNFMDEAFYSTNRAFLQKEATYALIKVNKKLKKYGLGLIIFDAYRPWYVTKMFWDATPNSLKEFVADPKKGSRHNRGTAVDVSLYNIKTGKPINMISGFDEFSPRAYPDFRGSTTLKRWYRNLLIKVMKSEGFTVYPNEWWHYDYQNWKAYPILNIKIKNIK